MEETRIDLSLEEEIQMFRVKGRRKRKARESGGDLFK